DERPGPGVHQPAAGLPAAGAAHGVLPGAQVSGDRRRPGHPARHGEVAVARGVSQAARGVERTGPQSPVPSRIDRGLRAGTEDWRAAVEENLLGHLLEANEPATQGDVEERLASDPAAVHEVARWRGALAPLEADRADADPPDDLWVRTLARVAGHMVATEGPATPREGMRTEELIRQAAAAAD